MRCLRGDLVEEIAHLDGLAQKCISFSVHKRSTKEGNELRMEKPRSPCEMRESLRQVERAQGEVRKPKCQRKEG